MKREQLRILKEVKRIINGQKGENLQELLEAFCDAEIQKLTKYTPSNNQIGSPSEINFTKNSNCTNGYINHVYHIHTFSDELRQLYEDKIKLLEEKNKWLENRLATHQNNS